ncbi:MAG: radical SAM family heme chaperone HemW [Peptococcaceae bacterium]|nr:radical SAM family heme chaperone HemW [Peptococcaceae bacterium]
MAAGLYIHVPFCLRKCHYCDFVSYPYDEDAAGEFLRSLGLEIDLYGDLLSPGEKVFSSVFIGGGTPTCLPAGSLSAVLERAGRTFTIPAGSEVTVEANPGTVDARKLKELRAAGVNRLSLGVQSFDDRLLGVLGRVHSAAEAVAAYSAAREAGFDNVNVDLIFGIPGQGEADWERTLRQAAFLGPDHVAAYSFQVEEGTPLALSLERGEISPCSEEMELAMYHLAMDFLKSKGYSHYEISNFARPGRESKHNLGYWHNGPYLGLGPAAHSYLAGRRHANEAALERYAGRLKKGELPVAEVEEIITETEMAETMFMGLRLLKGVSLRDFERRFGRRAEDVYAVEVNRLAGSGLVEMREGYLRLTEKGLPLANEVFKAFV